MKCFTIQLFVLICFKSIAQDPQLISNDWYLHKLVIDEVEHYTPAATESPVVAFFAEEFYIQHPSCKESSFYVIQYSGNNAFSATYGGGLIGMGCSWITEQFYGHHYSIYGPLADTSVTYTISTVGDQTTLVVTDVDGDQAIYGDQVLANESFSKAAFAIFPNPVQNVLKFSGSAEKGIAALYVYDVLRKAVLSVSFSSDELDVRQLSKGIYILELHFKNGDIATKKFVKN